MRVEESIEIDRPVETVWAMVNDLKNDPRWCRTVKSVEANGDGRWIVFSDRLVCDGCDRSFTTIDGPGMLEALKGQRPRLRRPVPTRRESGPR